VLCRIVSLRERRNKARIDREIGWSYLCHLTSSFSTEKLKVTDVELTDFVGVTDGTAHNSMLRKWIARCGNL